MGGWLHTEIKCRLREARVRPTLTPTSRFGQYPECPWVSAVRERLLCAQERHAEQFSWPVLKQKRLLCQCVGYVDGRRLLCGAGCVCKEILRRTTARVSRRHWKDADTEQERRRILRRRQGKIINTINKRRTDHDAFLFQLYSVSQKTTLFGSPQLRRTSTDFDNYWQKCCEESTHSHGTLFCHLTQIVLLHYQGKQKAEKCVFSL